MIIDLASRQRVDAREKRTVLIVEDNPRLLQALSNAVADVNLTVLSAKHYEAAIRQLEARRTYLVCIDIGLPDRSGYELCEYVRGRPRFARVPILATGEHGSAEYLAHAEYVGANGFLLKPFSIRQFVLCVQSMLDGRPDRTSWMHDLALLEPLSRRLAASTPRQTVVPISAA
jgi:DNA-binding response OmpR family regulator